MVVFASVVTQLEKECVPEVLNFIKLCLQKYEF